MKRIARSAIVEHSAGKLYALVDDIESYPRFLPWCVDAKVLERAPEQTVATLTAGMRGVNQSFTTRNETRAGASMRMHLVKGPFRHFEAGWTFRALSAQACRIDFMLEYEFSSRMLAKVLEPLFDRIADTMVSAFAKRADEVYGADG